MIPSDFSEGPLGVCLGVAHQCMQGGAQRHSLLGTGCGITHMAHTHCLHLQVVRKTSREVEDWESRERTHTWDRSGVCRVLSMCSAAWMGILILPALGVCALGQLGSPLSLSLLTHKTRIDLYQLKACSERQMHVKVPTSVMCGSLFLMGRRTSQAHPIWRAHGAQTSSHIMLSSLIFVSKRREAMDSYLPASIGDSSQESHGYQNPWMLKSCYVKWVLHLWIQAPLCFPK